MTAFLAGALFVSGEAFAQTLDWRGTASVEMAISTRNGAIQKTDFVLDPEVSGILGDWGQFTIIARLRADPADKIEPGQPEDQSAVRDPFSRRAFSGEAIDAELREAFLDIYAGNTVVRAGKQQVVWGQSDGLRVLDAVNPLHFREFILGPFEDRRIPLWMLNVERPFGDVTAQFLWIPDHTYNDIPAKGVFAFTSSDFSPAIPESSASSVTFEDTDKPNRIFADDDYGVRLTGFSSGWDWSLNWLYSYDDTRVLRRRIEAADEILITPGFERSHLIGGAASNAFGKLTLRLEAGVVTDNYLLTRDPTDVDGVISTPVASYVIGADYQLDGDTFLSAQVFQSVLVSPSEALVRDDVETTLSGLVRRNFRHNTVQAEALLLSNVNDGDGVLQLSLDYNLSDAVTISTGLDLFYGDEDGLFGQFDQADRFTFRLSRSF